MIVLHVMTFPCSWIVTYLITFPSVWQWLTYNTYTSQCWIVFNWLHFPGAGLCHTLLHFPVLESVIPDYNSKYWIAINLITFPWCWIVSYLITFPSVWYCLSDNISQFWIVSYLITFPSVDKLWLMAEPSFNLSPVAPVESARSLPAKSTKLMSLLLVLLSPPAFLMTCQNMAIFMNILRFLVQLMYIKDAGWLSRTSRKFLPRE